MTVQLLDSLSSNSTTELLTVIGLTQRRRNTHSERRCPLPYSEVNSTTKNSFCIHWKKTLWYAWLSSLSLLLVLVLTTNAHATSTTAQTPLHALQDHPRHPRVTDRACYLQTHYLFYGTPLTLVAEPSRAHNASKDVVTILSLTPPLLQ